MACYLPFTHAALMKNSHTAAPDSARRHYFKNVNERAQSGQLAAFSTLPQSSLYREMLTATSAKPASTVATYCPCQGRGAAEPLAAAVLRFPSQT